MTASELVENISIQFQNILKENYVGMYLHGSLATETFNWDKSDVDFIIVVKKNPFLETKIKLIEVLLELNNYAPKKGFEMSLVLAEVCKNFIYPTPYCLHYSNLYIKEYIYDIRRTCMQMKGNDKDLAVHFKMIKSCGKKISGKEIDEVFGVVSNEYYMDSVLSDLKDYEESILDNPIYAVLNLVRTLAYLEENVLLSKKEAGKWGVSHLKEHFTLINEALICYSGYKEMKVNTVDLKNFAKDLLKRIENKIENEG